VVAYVAIWMANVASGMSPTLPQPVELLAWGGNFLPATIAQPWRLFTAAFLHAGAIHLAFNMWALWNMGAIAERFYGNLQFLLIYLLSGLVSGFALATIMAEKFDWAEYRRKAASRALIAVGAAMVAAFLAWRMLPASVM